jgi:hypothetical protein
MSIGRSKEEQALTTLLASTLVAKEVIEPMNKIGWSHGTPPPPDFTSGSGQPANEGAPGQAAAPAPAPVTGQPASPEAGKPAPTGTPKADGPEMDAAALVGLYESLRDPKTGLIAGKYKTVEAAIKGSGHLAIMAKQAFTERDQANARVNSAPVAPSPVASPAAAPASQPYSSPSREKVDAAQARYDEVLSSVAENGGILDADTTKRLSKAQRELTEAVTQYQVEETRTREQNATRAEKAKWDDVESFMLREHPESARFSEEVALHIESDPLLAAAVNALLAQEKRLEATLTAWTSFQRTHSDMLSAETRAKAEEKEADLAAREQVRKERVEAARKDAGVITGSAGGAGVHEGRDARASAEEIEAMRERMRREGDSPGSPAAMRFRQMVIPLDPRYFGGGGN